MQISVSKVIQKFGPSSAAGTAKFCEIADLFFDCLNVRNTKEASVKLKPFLKPYSSVNDERFEWLSQQFINYFKQWKDSINFRLGKFSADDRSKMFISRQTYEGIQITAYSTVELIKFLLNNGVPYVLSGKFSQDSLENYFGRQRALGCRKTNPSLVDFGYNDNAIRNSKLFRPIAGGNCEDDEISDITNEKLPSRKTKRKQSHE